MCTQFADILMDEMALEGLDGITLQTLWIRLKVRLNVECIPDQLRNYVWQFICNSNDVVCYELPTDRKDFVPVDRAQSVSSGLNGDYKYPEDIYGFAPINRPDEKGSCTCYTARTRIPISTIENKNCSEIEEKYGTKLVIVASQPLRNKVLSQGRPTSLLSTLNLESYCILERIGRSRFMGEATVGPHSLKNFKLKHSYGYVIKFLIDYELVTQQFYCYGRLFQLKRFQQLFLPKFYKALHGVISELIKRPSMSLSTDEVNAILHNDYNHTKRKKLTFPKAVVLEAGSSLNQKDSNLEKINKCSIKTYRLTDPNFDFTNWYLKRNFNEIDKKEANNNGEDVGMKINQIFTSSRFSQIIKIFYERGQEGVTIADICRRVNIDHKRCLKVMQNYVKLNIFNTIKEEFGKVRRYKYILPSFNNKEAELKKDLDNDLEMNLDLEQEPEPEPEADLEPELKPVVLSLKEPDQLSDVSLTANESQTVIDDETKIDYEIIQRKFPKTYSNNVHRKKILKRYCITITHEFKVNTILKYLAKHAVITNLQAVVLYFIDCGYQYTIDRKTIRKFLVKLAELDYVNIFDIRFIHKPTNTSRDFVIYSNSKTKSNNCCVSVEIEKMKLIFMNQMKFEVGKDQNRAPAVRTRIEEVQFRSDREFLKSLGFKPKNERTRLIHNFLFYLVFEEQKHGCIFNENEYEMWKNFIPTFLSGVNNIPGTILLSTVLQNMPVSLIIQIVQLSKYVPEFEEFVRNPLKRLYLYKDLPSNVQLMFHNRTGFFFRQYIRNYIRIFVSYGLAQVANYYNNDIVIYLNRNLTLKDTRNCRNDILTYRLNSISDLQVYWNQLKEISLSLDNPKSLRPRQDRFKEQCFVKQCFKYVTSLEDFPLHDNGHVPGDGKGVAGFNSSVHFYHSQGWSFERRIKIRKKYPKKKKPKKAIVMNKGANPVKVVVRKKSSNNSRKQFRLKILDQCVKKITTLPKANVTFEEHNVLILCQLVANFFYKNPSRIFIRAFLKQIAQSVVPSLKKMALKNFHVKINAITSTSLIVKKLEQALTVLKSDNELCKSFYREETLKNFKTNPQKVYDLYKEFFNFIYTKYKTFDVILMQKDKQFDIAELENYVIIKHEDDDNEIVNKPLTFNDIKSQTFQSIILSVIFSQQDKTNIDLQLKEVLATFDFDLKAAVCDLLKRLQIISYDKPYTDNSHFPYKSAAKLWSFLTFKYTPEYYYKSYLIQEDVLDSLKYKNCVQIESSNDYYVWFFKKWSQIDSEFGVDVDVIVPNSMFRNVSDQQASRWNYECNVQETYNFILNDFKTNAIMDSKEGFLNEIETVKNVCRVRWESVNKLSMSINENDNSCDSLSKISNKFKIEVETLSEIVNLIKSNTYNGLSAIFLKEKIGSLFDQKNIKLLDVLEALESDAKLILQTGLNQIVYVHQDYWKPWIVTSTKLTRLEKEKIIGSTNALPELPQIDVAVTPWIRIDGSLNRRLFDHLICMLLNYCIENTTVKFIQVVNHYYFLSPVHIFVLLKFLRDLNCVKIQKLVQVKGEVTLFTTSSEHYEYVTGADDFDDFNGLLIETNPDCCLIMTNYISNKKYSVFLNR